MEIPSSSGICAWRYTEWSAVRHSYFLKQKALHKTIFYLVFQCGGVQTIEHSPEESHGVSHDGLGARSGFRRVAFLRVIQPDAHRAHETRQNAEYLAVGEALQAQVIREGECECAGEVAVGCGQVGGKAKIELRS